MKLYVKVVEAKDLLAADSNGFSDPYVKLSLGNTKARTSVVHKSLNPCWNEDFFFNVTDLDEELKLTVWDEDRFTDDFLGQARIKVSDVLDSDKQSISHTSFRLQKRSEKSKGDVTGEIFLDLALFGRTFHGDQEASEAESNREVSVTPPPKKRVPPRSVHSSVDDEEGSFMSTDVDEDQLSEVSDLGSDRDSESSIRSDSPSTGAVLNLDAPLVKEFVEVEKKKTAHGQAIAEKLSSIFQKKGRKSKSRLNDSFSLSPGDSSTARLLGVDEDSSASPEPTANLIGEDVIEGDEEVDEDVVPLSFFQDDEKSVGASPEDFPSPLSGGVLVDQRFAVSFKALNAVLFKPETPFAKELADIQKTTEMVTGPWKKIGNEPMNRTFCYIKAPTRLVKAVSATEVQTYLRADDKGFAVLCSVSTPDVPYGKNFLCELLFVITPGPDLSSGGKTSRLHISWRMNFLQNTMMRGMIINGAGQGLRESYIGHQQVLAKYVKPLDGSELTGETTGTEVPPVGEPKTDWELARHYFGNWTVLLTMIGFVFIMLHLILVKINGRGLQFWIFDFPDSFMELFFVALLTREVERVGRMVRKFVAARSKISDHGVKAKGTGWLLSVTLVEAQDLYSIDSDGSCDPYVVLTCNGKMRTSSVILGTTNPEWKEVYEFDATEDLPSTLDIEVLDYDGPFSEAELLGHAMINFLKSKASDYADVWLPLEGKHAQGHGSKLHLRVVLENTKAGDLRPEFINNLEKEAGTKIVRRSPQRTTQFQKLFSVPPEEFLVNDYACAIKRKIPIQGRLFLSPRMLGFYSNLFGHKTKFSFLWEDVEEIKESSPSRDALFNPSITITLRQGRAPEARQGSKGVDSRGRLRFKFMSFVRPGPAIRTIIALWRNRCLSVEQTMELIASMEAGDMKYAVAERQADDSQSTLGFEEAHMSQVADRDFPATVKQLSHLVEYGALDHQVMELFCVNNYKATPWENVGDDQNARRREVSYVMSRQQCRFGSSVKMMQQKTIANDLRSAVYEEMITLQDVPFGDQFQVQVRRESFTVTDNPPVSHFRVYAGVAWHKNAGFQKKSTKSIISYMSHFLREYLDFAAKIIAATPVEAFESVEPTKDSSVSVRRMLPSILPKLIKT